MIGICPLRRPAFLACSCSCITNNFVVDTKVLPSLRRLNLKKSSRLCFANDARNYKIEFQKLLDGRKCRFPCREHPHTETASISQCPSISDLMCAGFTSLPLFPCVRKYTNLQVKLFSRPGRPRLRGQLTSGSASLCLSRKLCSWVLSSGDQQDYG